MKRLVILSISDLRSTFREPMFKVLLLFPFLAYVIVRYVLPVICEKYPVIVPYKEVVLMWACLQSATMFGFIYGFLLLEEKEENIWQMIRITPVSVFTVVLSRLLIGVLISFIVNFFLISFGNIVDLPIVQEIILSFLYSLAAPLIALSLGALAKNRIEGLAQMKIVNIVLILPAMIYFLPYKAAHLTALAPTYWSNRALESAGDTSNFILFSLASLMIHIIFIFFLNRRLGRVAANT